MNIVIYITFVCIFFLLTPGILFSISKNKYISAFIHSIIFAIFCSFFLKNLEGLDEDPKYYLDTSCNVIFNVDESTPMYVIKNDKCINVNDSE
jgi:hypothetical protein